MLKGHVFNLQTFTSEAFALFIDKFLNGRCGIARGCSLSNTNNSATISEGYFVIKGRFLQIISSETVSSIVTDGYYSLICEIDLSKTNTTEELNQAEIKTIYSANSYPTLIQQDITDTGIKYQYEFARFKVENGNITGFTDKRTFVNFATIFELIENESQELINEIQEALQSVLDGSIYFLKDNIAVFEGSITISASSSNSKEISYPSGYNSTNCVPIACGIKNLENKGFNYVGFNKDSAYSINNAWDRRLNLTSSNIVLVIDNPNTSEKTVSYKIILMRIS